MADGQNYNRREGTFEAGRRHALDRRAVADCDTPLVLIAARVEWLDGYRAGMDERRLLR
jgi:ribosome modulation factor